MGNTRTFYLEQVRDGDSVFVSGCSQCSSTVKVTFKGLDKSVELTKDNKIRDHQLLNGSTTARKGLGPLSFTIEISGQDDIAEENRKMKVTQHITALTDKDGREQGFCYVYNIEDVANGDEDFNDYYINVATWHRSR